MSAFESLVTQSPVDSTSNAPSSLSKKINISSPKLLLEQEIKTNLSMNDIYESLKNIEKEEVNILSKQNTLVSYPLKKSNPIALTGDSIFSDIEIEEYLPEIVANMHSKEQSQDIYNFISKITNDEKYPLDSGDLNNLYPRDISVVDRRKAIDWLYYIYKTDKDRLKLTPKILFSTIALIDRCLVHPVFANMKKKDMSLLVITCLRLISKLTSRDIDIDEYLYISGEDWKKKDLNELELKILNNVGFFSELITFYNWDELFDSVNPKIIQDFIMYLGIITNLFPELFINYLPSEIYAGMIYLALTSYGYKWLEALNSYLNITEDRAKKMAQEIYNYINKERLIRSLREYKEILPKISVEIKNPN